MECTVSQRNHPEGITERQKDIKYRLLEDIEDTTRKRSFLEVYS